MIHSKLIGIVNDMRQEIETLEDDSAKSMMEGASDFSTARTLRKYADQIETSVYQDAKIITQEPAND